MPKLNPPACAQAKQLPIVRPTAVKAGTLPLDLLQTGVVYKILEPFYWSPITVVNSSADC